jgi:2,4-dienoyl-CoA reductase-like NADH-dependent reductase (Old Yellow Enzyme family)
MLKKIKINKVTLQNKIIIGPMCQYSAISGKASDWHYKHLGHLSKLGAGLLMLESTSVNLSGRISKKDLQLTNNIQQKSLFKLFKYLKKQSDTAIGIQISHSGRKGSAEIPWVKHNSPLKKNNGSWNTLAPSAIKRDKKWPVPKEINKYDLKKVAQDFVKSSIRAKKIGFDCLEIHMAHGYLLHQFLSPISNKRKDEYGGNLKNRCRYPLEVFKRIRKIWPKNKILGVRITASDNLALGLKINDAIYLVKELKKLKADYIAVTSGGIVPKTKIKFRDGYQVNYAYKIKKATGMRVVALGMINSENLIKNIFKNKKADLIAVSRRFINDPFWLIKHKLKINKDNRLLPKPYTRCF